MGAWGSRARRVIGCAVAAVVVIGCAPARLDAGPSNSPSQSAAAATPTSLPTLIGPARNVPVPPDGKSYFGVQLDWSVDTPATYTARLGRSPAVYGRYVPFPISDSDKRSLTAGVDQIAAQHAMFDLTVEPYGGLKTVTQQSVDDLASTLAGWNRRGVDILVRFGHEMNGGWYPWGQQPIEFINAFRMVADAVHKVALKTVMVWSPNYGGGYPFTGMQYSAKPGTPDYALLDTNHDGKLTENDDAYAPYYPGDQYVDWVALSLYNWGCYYPWGQNVVPEPNKFVNQVTGAFNDQCGDDRALTNYYNEFPVAHHKPMALSETSALYNDAHAGQGATDLQIKQAWISQVLDPSLSTRFPLLKEENWFEFQQTEAGVTGTVDWRATTDPAILAVLKSYLGPRFILAPVAQQ
jgi:hypothetical protein